MQTITTIGLDIAKSVFQVHGVDAGGQAICEAVTRANMRFVPTKTPEQQSGLVLHRAAICSSASRPR